MTAVPLSFTVQRAFRCQAVADRAERFSPSEKRARAARLLAFDWDAGGRPALRVIGD
jgi:hypothetical protein